MKNKAPLFYLNIIIMDRHALQFLKNLIQPENKGYIFKDLVFGTSLGKTTLSSKFFETFHQITASTHLELFGNGITDMTSFFFIKPRGVDWWKGIKITDKDN